MSVIVRLTKFRELSVRVTDPLAYHSFLDDGDPGYLHLWSSIHCNPLAHTLG